MKKKQFKNLINNNYKIIVLLQSNKNYNKMILKTILINNENNIVYEIYYNHFKKYLNKNQLNFIEYYKKAKLLKFNEIVELNIKSKENTLNKDEMALLIMYKAIKNMEYLEQK